MPLGALIKVFQRPAYAIFALVIGSSTFAFATWFPNLSLIVEVMGHPDATLAQKIELSVSLLGSITTNFSALSATYTILISILFGINLAMLAYFLRNRIALVRESGVATGALGVVSGLLGVGCAACGSLILTSVLSLVGVAGVLAFFPLKGAEFGILGVLLLFWSVFLVAKHIEDPLVCKS
jgi:hypothetical protein